ncbi:pantoate--beta-alanine ligase [Kordia algicida OT-1]|uniref:Pantothenate synthetase n=1 Tax=Kordia algicida OT-1 TaxID=391587 RepID=A9DLC3_9FLAO|nr:pantoate--beta-alanine ligase [Kordia algicida]EDP98536.1 pantoate-beta-alanine ligase [Kordia algicida OT-1]
MTIFYTQNNLKTFVEAQKSEGKTIGFVPTMGALHEGHLSLVRNAMTSNDIVFVSVFVNPTQFDNATDLEKYPRTLDADVELLKTLGKNIFVYAPSVADIYNSDVNAEKFSFDGLEFEMEGKFRKGHFDGVGTIVKRLFEIITPHNAYFGEKDFQQLMIIKKLASKYKLPVNVIGCEIYREPSGLAMSSRNQRLSENARKESAFIYKTLLEAKKKFGTKSAMQVKEWVQKQFNKHPLLTLEYVEIANIKNLKTVKRKSKNQTYRIFIAAFIENIRLIDNIALN